MVHWVTGSILCGGSIERSTTVLTKVMVCVVVSVGWCI